MAVASNVGGMICRAVWTWAITDLNREEQRGDVERTFREEPRHLSAISSAFENPSVRTPRSSMRSMIRSLVLAPELLVALAADAEELDLLAFGDQRIRPLTREPHDRRIERPAQPALGRAHDQAAAPGRAPVPREQRRAPESAATEAAMLPSTLSMRSA